MTPILLAQASGLAAVPLEGQVLFIGVVFLGTLAISRFSVKVGIPAILGVRKACKCSPWRWVA